jgi:NADPH-dependent curcumin reductase CurA
MLKAITTVVEGFERLPEVIVGLYWGSRVGKLQIRFESP